uniref:Uncharacterized protein n=1 Tax=Arundo donax TaxID=35708 RepID=A0A0A9HGF6_ARUDO
MKNASRILSYLSLYGTLRLSLYCKTPDLSPSSACLVLWIQPIPYSGVRLFLLCR